jgi:hypothetical protein
MQLQTKSTMAAERMGRFSGRNTVRMRKVVLTGKPSRVRKTSVSGRMI